MHNKYQETVDKVNKNLPLRVTASDVETYSQFSHLLSALSQQLHDDGLSKSTKLDMDQAEDSLRQAKSNWLTQQVLYSSLQDWLMEQASGVNKHNHGQHTDKNLQYHSAVQECLALAEIGDYLQCSQLEPNTTLLGLNFDDIKKLNPHGKHIASLQQQFIPEIEAKLRNKCENLVSIHQPNVQSQDSRFAFAAASQMPGVLEEELEQLERERKQLAHDKYSREKQFWHYYKTLLESLEVLERLITRHRLSAQKEKDKITGEYLMARCDALCLKVRQHELSILCDTYQQQNVQALTAIENSVNKTLGNSESEYSQVKQSLQTYEGVGQGFDEIVQEFTRLREEIDNKTWAMRELQQSLDSVERDSVGKDG